MVGANISILPMEALAVDDKCSRAENPSKLSVQNSVGKNCVRPPTIRRHVRQFTRNTGLGTEPETAPEYANKSTIYH